MKRRLKQFSLVMIFIMLLSLFGPNWLGITKIRGENVSLRAEMTASTETTVDTEITSTQTIEEPAKDENSEGITRPDVIEEVSAVSIHQEELLPGEESIPESSLVDAPEEITEEPSPLEELNNTPPQEEVEEPIPLEIDENDLVNEEPGEETSAVPEEETHSEPGAEITQELREEKPEVSVEEIVEEQEETAEETTKEITEEETTKGITEEETEIAILPFADAQPGDEYFSTVEDAIELVVDVTGSSTNTHTRPGLIWVGNDGYLHFAIRSTHELQYMTLSDGTQSVTVQAKGTEAIVFSAMAPIYLDGTLYSPDQPYPLSGNTKDTHWTVFRISMGALNLDPDMNYYTLFVKGIGGGHDLPITPLVIKVPYVTASVSKTWLGGPMYPVTVQLQRRVNSGTWEIVGESITLSVDSNTYTWNSLPYTNAGGQIYEYKIDEAYPGQGYDVEFTSTYDHETRTYIWTLVNTYNLIPTTTKVSVEKQLEGRDWMVGDSFTISRAGNINELLYYEEVTVTDGTITDFGDITFELPGTYTFTVTEVEGSLGGIIYDTDPKTVTITVTDNDDGTLTAVVNPSPVIITNTYKPEPVTVPVEVQKQLDGREWMAGDSFTFTLIGTIDGEEVIREVTVENGEVTNFDPITFTQTGTYTFTVSEVEGDIPGITYDVEGKEIAIEITDDPITGMLIATDPGILIFKNSYHASGSYSLDVKKVLIGRGLLAGEFKFEILDEADQVIETVGNSADGMVLFKAIEFNESHIGKTLSYKVREIPGTHGNIEYDKNEFEIQLKVEDVGDGNLIVERVDAENDPSIIFTNTWKTKNITGTKIWKGGPETKPVIWLKLQRAAGTDVHTDVPGAVIFELNGITEVTWSNLEVNNEKGTAYIYRVVEVNAEGNDYVPGDYEKVEEGLSVTNTYISKPTPTSPPTTLPTTKPVDPAPIVKTGEQSLYTGLGGTLLLGAIAMFLIKRKRETSD